MRPERLIVIPHLRAGKRSAMQKIAVDAHLRGEKVKIVVPAVIDGTAKEKR